jgi:hypothetical protein
VSDAGDWRVQSPAHPDLFPTTAAMCRHRSECGSLRVPHEYTRPKATPLVHLHYSITLPCCTIRDTIGYDDFNMFSCFFRVVYTSVDMFGSDVTQLGGQWSEFTLLNSSKK